MLTAAEQLRYARHLVLPGFGAVAQLRLKTARVLIVGAGGLGSPAALYLAAAGIGQLGIADDDTVAVSNLQRQILHGTGMLAMPKVASAHSRLSDLNPTIAIETYRLRLDASNIDALVAAYDVIVDGTDNFATRYLLTDASARHTRPLVYGSIYQFDGQVTVFYPAAGGPCYRCLYPTPPPANLVPDCATGGVLGVLPGVIGTIQATEVIKIVTGIGTTLRGRLLLYDALTMRVDEIAIARNPACPLCGDAPHEPPSLPIAQLDESEHVMPGADLTPAQVAARAAETDAPLLLDVREEYEWNLGHLPGAIRIAIGELPQRVGELDPQRETIVYCRSGARSAQAADFLRQSGFRQVWNMTGGTLRWADDIDPTMPKY